MTVTICDRCGTEGASWCQRHQLDECDTCADICVASGTAALRSLG